MTKDNGCVGSYSVSGYTRGDGVQVSGYTRTCGAAHNSSSSSSSKTSTPKLDDEEKMKQRAELLYPTMRENKTNNEDSENTNSKINNEIKHNEKFRNSMNVVFDNEGGFSDDKDDLGGRTNMGITQSTYDSYCNKRGIKQKMLKILQGLKQ